ncbi:hypothetical protein ACTXT7_016151 [Hymenolepis weldensis]
MPSNPLNVLDSQAQFHSHWVDVYLLAFPISSSPNNLLYLLSLPNTPNSHTQFLNFGFGKSSIKDVLPIKFEIQRLQPPEMSCLLNIVLTLTISRQTHLQSSEMRWMRSRPYFHLQNTSHQSKINQERLAVYPRNLLSPMKYIGADIAVLAILDAKTTTFQITKN